MAEFKELTIESIDTVTAMMKDFYEIDGYPFNEELTRQNFQLFIKEKDFGKCFVIYDDNNEVNGYIILAFFFSFEFGGRSTILDELYLNENARGKGLGKVAVDFVKNYAKEQQLKMMFLEIELHNERAINLYLDKGFKMHNRNLMIYVNE